MAVAGEHIKSGTIVKKNASAQNDIRQCHEHLADFAFSQE